jgi:hypothetical protein
VLPLMLASVPPQQPDRLERTMTYFPISISMSLFYFDFLGDFINLFAERLAQIAQVF